MDIELSKDDMEKLSKFFNTEKPKWKDVRGIAPNLLDGEDAQTWDK